MADRAVAQEQTPIVVAVIDAAGIFQRVEEVLLETIDQTIHVRLLPPEPRVATAWAWSEGQWLRRTATVAKIDSEGLFERIEEIGVETLDTIDAKVHVPSLPPGPRAAMAWAWREGRWLRRAALLDADGVYLEIDEVEPDKLTSRHLPQLFDCDNQPKRYRWAPDPASQIGGSLFPLPPQTPEQKFLDTEPLPAMAMFMVRIWSTKLVVLPPVTEKWLDWYVRTVDFKTYRDAPEVIAFMKRNEGVSA